ncbi:MAG: hypothetical protein HQL44_13810 [Alphaproteobacteria bacterium]|nr:hypothetical protein [Alphaproteobacteria bacterium]
MTALVLLASLAVAAGVTELGALIYFLVRDGRFIPMAKRRETLLGGSMTVKGIIPLTASYYETVFPHPWLGFVHHANPPHSLPHINNIGLFGRDFPLVRDEDYFTILITGGSVAAQFGQIFPNGPLFLEEHLNRHYKSPNGKPFRTLNGGDGAWKQPQQAIMLLLYANAVDAIVSLEGFNEYWLLGGHSSLAKPADNFQAVSPLAANTRSSLIGRSLSTALKRLLVATPVLRSSFLAMLVLSGTADWIARRWVHRPRGSWKTTIDSLFALPDTWPEEMCRTYQMVQYKSFMLTMEDMARRFALKSAYFIQPIPAIDKPLSPEETAEANPGMAGAYEAMRDQLLELRSQGLNIHSLTHIFNNEAERVYADWIHCVTEPNGESKGYRIMAQAIGDFLAASWNLERQDGQAPLASQDKAPATGETGSLFDRDLKALGWHGRRITNLEQMVENLQVTLKAREETISRMQARETERLRQEMIRQGLLPPEIPQQGA